MLNRQCIRTLYLFGDPAIKIMIIWPQEHTAVGHPDVRRFGERPEQATLPGHLPSVKVNTTVLQFPV